MKLHPETPCEVYELKISNLAYHKIKKRLMKMSEQPEQYQYSILGTLYYILGIQHKRKNRYFCSQFIGELLKESGAVTLPKHESLMHPADYRSLTGCKLLYHGNIRGVVRHYLKHPHSSLENARLQISYRKFA